LTTLNLNRADSNNVGGVGGLQGGYNWQFAPAWVAGIEGDFSWTSLSDRRITGPVPIAIGGLFGGPTSTVAMSADTRWLASVRGKLGFTGWFNNTMFYATGGAAWANVDYAAALTSPGPGANAITSFNSTRSGWVVGGGAEWRATANILLRAEYLYYNFDSKVTGSASINAAALAGVFPLPFNYIWNGYNVQVFRVAASYKF